MDKQALADVLVVDTDSHVTEPLDLWTSRVPRDVIDKVPHVEFNEKKGHSCWRIGDVWLAAPGTFATAGRATYETEVIELEDADPGSWQASERLKRMDEYGVYSQVLYPNIIGFDSKLFIDELGPELSLVCAQAYNDFLIDFASADPKRLIPIAMVPFWDIEASVAEMKRCREKGHKGVLFANKYERIGFPSFTDEYWDPIYQAAVDLDMSINFHVGFGWSRGREITKEITQREAKAAGREMTADSEITHQALRDRLHVQLDPDDPDSEAVLDPMALQFLREAVMTPVLSQLTNQDTITAFLLSNLPSRFPALKFVSVESGFGFIPYLLESLDWHWKGEGLQRYLPDLPSEIYRRQCYGTFWFEKSTLPLLQNYPDNFMFSTDYPHNTSIAPGPASPADLPSVHIANAFANIPDEIARKALHGNAAAVYHL